MNVKNWNFYYKKKNNIFTMDFILDTVFFGIAIGLCWVSFIEIINEYYTIALYDVLPNQETFLWIIIWQFVLWLFYEVIFIKWKRIRIMGEIVFPLVNMGAFLWYAMKYATELAEGFLALANVYVKSINVYYKTNYVITGGVEDYMPYVIILLASVLWYLLWVLSYCIEKRILLIVFPLVPLLLQLFVGYSPKGNAVFYIFLGAWLLLTLEHKHTTFGEVRKKDREKIIFWKLFCRLSLPIVLILVFAGSSLFLKPTISKETLITQKQSILTWQENLNLATIWKNIRSSFDLLSDKQRLDNHTPQYTGEVVLNIEATNKPLSNLYLKEFYGTDYEDGVWKCDKHTFQNACKTAGYSEKEIAKIISQMPIDYRNLHQEELVNAYNNTNIKQDEKNEYVIHYKNSLGNTAYVPYYFDTETLDETYHFSEDYKIEKSVWDTSTKVTGIENGDIPTNVVIENDYISHLPNLEQKEWYQKFVSTYLETPEEVQALSGIINDFESELGDWYTPYYNYNFDSAWTDDVFYAVSALSYVNQQALQDNLSNIYRQEVARKLANYFDETMSYSLYLDELPVGQDPVVYALTQSKKGYCMHFASAATLILRELDIPARYVSGYVVRPSDFKWSESKGAHEAVVKDYASHAWVEIYLDYVGWIPIEVTPGYDVNTGKLPTQMESQQNDNSPTSSQNDTQKESEQNDTMQNEATQQEDESEHIEETNEDLNIENDNTNPLGNESQNGNSLQNNNSQGFIDKIISLLRVIWDILQRYLPILLTILGIVLLGIAIYIGGKRIYAYYEAILQQEIEQKQTRKAVKRINRRIYRYLFLLCMISKNSITTKHMTDIQYEQLLKTTFLNVSTEEWEQYMRIVKKMYYSLEEISEEEMLYCYQCYKKCYKNSKK